MQLLSVLWCFQGHRGRGHPHLRVSIAFTLDNEEVVAKDLDRLGRWRFRSMRSQPILEVDDWSQLRRALRLSD